MVALASWHYQHNLHWLYAGITNQLLLWHHCDHCRYWITWRSLSCIPRSCALLLKLWSSRGRCVSLESKVYKLASSRTDTLNAWKLTQPCSQCKKTKLNTYPLTVDLSFSTSIPRITTGRLRCSAWYSLSNLARLSLSWAGILNGLSGSIPSDPELYVLQIVEK